mmetsp:Transcript_23161/g.63111  ORF Transcript_23161/g.63111 Transcript_23161/m.63111 type:complete len:292 (-) Transcript_23161:730-1605(-)
MNSVLSDDWVPMMRPRKTTTERGQHGNMHSMLASRSTVQTVAASCGWVHNPDFALPVATRCHASSGDDQLPAALGALGLLMWGWRRELLCRLRELHAGPAREERRLVLVGDRRVHQRAVAVALNVVSQALVRNAPTHAAHLVAGEHPLAVSVKHLPEARYHGGINQIDEGVAQSSTSVKVDGEIHVIVLARKAMHVEHPQEHAPPVVERQVLQHDGGAAAGRALRGSLGCKCSGANCDLLRLRGLANLLNLGRPAELHCALARELRATRCHPELQGHGNARARRSRCAAWQ